MAEKFANLASTTLNGAIDDTETSVIVTSATDFPTSGDFRIKVEDEIMLVTGVSSNTFTVSRGAESTTAASHADATDVIHVLTKGAMETLVQGPSSATDNGIPVYDSTGGKLLKGSNYQISTSHVINRITSNAPVIVGVNGTSALIQATSDGNTRGQGAVDLVVSRSSASQVASGNNSAVIAGIDNTASAQRSVVFGGSSNNTNSGSSAIVGGSSHTIDASSGSGNAIVGGSSNSIDTTTGSPSNCAILGGNSNFVIGSESAISNAIIVGGDGNVSYSNRSVILGGQYNASLGDTNRNQVLMGEYAVGYFNNAFTHAGTPLSDTPSLGGLGCQVVNVIICNETTNSTPVPLYLDGKAATKSLTIPDNCAGMIESLITGLRDDGTHRCVKMTGTFHNDGTSLSVTAGNVEYADGDVVSWNVAYSTSGDDLRLMVTGDSSQTVRWMAAVRLTMLYHAQTGGTSA